MACTARPSARPGRLRPDRGAASPNHGVRQRHLIAPLPLRGVHRAVGGAEQRVTAGVASCCRHTDAHGELDLLDEQVDGGGDRLHDPPPDHHGLLDLLQARAHDGELVAPEARECVPGADQRPHPVGDRPQQRVTGFVSQAVVHLLEAVEIAEEDGDVLTTAPLRPAERVLKPQPEELPVRQPGERVVQRLAFELIDGRLPLPGVHQHVGDRAQQLQLLL